MPFRQSATKKAFANYKLKFIKAIAYGMLENTIVQHCLYFPFCIYERCRAGFGFIIITFTSNMAGIYIHIPFCKTRCLYCDFFSTAGEEGKAKYIEAVCWELRMRKAELAGESIETVYFGGGTPSRLEVPEFAKIFETLDKEYGLSDCTEITVEANPDDLSPAYLGSLRGLPFNRISLGIQSFDDGELKFLNRRHTSAQAVEAIESAHTAGYGNISLDLMYGLPGQTMEKWEQTLQRAVSVGVQHISAYHLIYEEGTPLYRLLGEGHIFPVEEELSKTMFERLIDCLAGNGFLHYEISNFGLPDYLARHNTSYWKNIPYLGIGASAHSYTGGIRQWNVADLHRYTSGVLAGNRPAETEPSTPDTRYNERVLTSLRTMWGLDMQAIGEEFGTDRLAYCREQAIPYLRSGMLVEEGGMMKVTRQGLFVSDRIISDLLFVG